MSSSVQSSIQQLQEHFEREEQRVKILEHLLDKLKRESLALLRQTDYACELFTAHIEELEEQIGELTEQEEFFLARLAYWRQRYSDLEESKRIAEQRYFSRIERQVAIEMSYKITQGDLWSMIKEKDLQIQSLKHTLRASRVPAGVGESQATASGGSNEPNSDDDVIPDWLANNSPEDWYGIALRASRSQGSEESSAERDDVDVSEGDVSEGHMSEQHGYGTDPQFQAWSSVSSDSGSNNLHDEDRELRGSDAGSDVSQSGSEDREIPEDVENLRAEVERLRLQVKSLKEKDRTHERQKRKRDRLYAKFLRWAPETLVQGWSLTHEVRKAYKYCQKIVEALKETN